MEQWGHSKACTVELMQQYTKNDSMHLSQHKSVYGNNLDETDGLSSLDIKCNLFNKNVHQMF